MMKKLYPYLLLLFIAVSCNDAAETQPSETTEPISEPEDSKIDSSEPEENIDSLVKVYAKTRRSIEEVLGDLDQFEITADKLREPVRQKWSKIHVYSKDGAIKRIKTYPYKNISKRTEEFYFHEGQLAVVVMENEGEWTQFKSDSTLDKVFYFDNGRLIGEEGDKSPYEDWKDMGHELIQEAIEYTELYRTLINEK